MNAYEIMYVMRPDQEIVEDVIQVFLFQVRKLCLELCRE